MIDNNATTTTSVNEIIENLLIEFKLIIINAMNIVILKLTMIRYKNLIKNRIYRFEKFKYKYLTLRNKIKNKFILKLLISFRKFFNHLLIS